MTKEKVWKKAIAKVFKNKNTKGKWVLEILLVDTGKVLYRDGAEYEWLKDHDNVMLYLDKAGKIVRIRLIEKKKKLNIEKLLKKKSIRRILGDGE